MDRAWLFLGRASPLSEEPGQIVPVALLIRMVELTESMLVVGERGFVAPTRILLRSLLETLFVIGAVCKDEGILEQWALNSSREKLRRLRKLTRSVTFGSHPDVVALEADLRDDLERAVESLQKTELSAEFLAMKSGLHNLYLTAYAQYCADVHSSGMSLGRQLRVDSKGRLTEIVAGPASEDIPYLMSLAGLMLIEAVRRVACSRGLGVDPSVEESAESFAELIARCQPEEVQ